MTNKSRCKSPGGAPIKTAEIQTQKHSPLGRQRAKKDSNGKKSELSRKDQYSLGSPKACRGVHIGTKFAPSSNAVEATANTLAPPLSLFSKFSFSDNLDNSNFKFSFSEPISAKVGAPASGHISKTGLKMVVSDPSPQAAPSTLPVRSKGELEFRKTESKGLSSGKIASMASSTSKATEEQRLRKYQLSLLVGPGQRHKTQQEIKVTPVFTHQVLKNSTAFTQYGFLAGKLSDLKENPIEDGTSYRSSDSDSSHSDSDSGSSKSDTDLSESYANSDFELDPRLYFNIAAPSSAFICGSQGSGKSHTLSCLLENCLIKSDVSKLDRPLAGLVLHYDSFTSDVKGTPCEAAYLSSHKSVKVKVLCSPTNIETIKRTYAGLNIQVEALRIDESHLNTKRMLDLMAVNTENGPMPLYLHSINRILRDLRIEQQALGGSFNYAEFKRRVEETELTLAQKAPLEQRLDTLESFMEKSQTGLVITNGYKKKVAKQVVRGNDWTIEPGSLTIVDLSCPCVTSEGACALFNICLGIFLEQKTLAGRVIALDEAHKYMNEATEAASLTETLLQAIRLQRHLGTRVVISTQEPTISPKLIDLCSVTIVHRFSSPEWLRCLRLHLAALDNDDMEQKSGLKKVFSEIVKLNVGEALLFAPSAIMRYEKTENGEQKVKKLGIEYLKIVVRGRITTDGGKSVMAD